MSNPEFTEGAAAVVIPTTHDMRPVVEQIPQRLEIRPPASVIPTNPAEMLYLAMARGQGMDELRQFMDLKDRWEASEAKKAFVEAMSHFKAETIHIAKDKENLQYKSKYVSLGNLVASVTPFLSKHGLSITWDQDQTKAPSVLVIGTITHVMGHSVSSSFLAPPDTSGAKNPVQQLKSAITYGRGVTFEALCGLASTDANLDDDGNGTSGAPAHQADVDRIKAASTLKDCQDIYTETYRKASAANDKKAMDALLKAKDERKAELQKGK